jgi:hypothetical protein
MSYDQLALCGSCSVPKSSIGSMNVAFVLGISRPPPSVPTKRNPQPKGNYTIATSAARIRYFKSLGLPTLIGRCLAEPIRTAVHGPVRMVGWCDRVRRVTAAAMPIQPGRGGAWTSVRLHPLYRDCPA